MVKMCIKCKLYKLTIDFYNRSTTKDGLNTACKECSKKYRKDYHSKIKEDPIFKNKRREQAKKYYSKIRLNKSKKIKISKKERDKEKTKINIKNWYEVHKHDDNFKAKRRAYSMKRYATKLKRTPKWLTEEQFREIEMIYELAQELSCFSIDGLPFHVDHIIPLQAENISGLHVPWNLQILSATENITKGNRYENNS